MSSKSLTCKKRISDVEEIEEEEEAEEDHRVDPLEDLLTGELKQEEAHEQTETKKTQFVIEGQEEERAEATATEPAPKRRARRAKATGLASTESEVKSEVPVQSVESFAATTETPTTSTAVEAVEEIPELASTTTETQHAEGSAPSLLPQLETIPEKLSECKDTERLWKKVVRMMGGEYALSLWVPLQKEDRRKTAYSE